MKFLKPSILGAAIIGFATLSAHATFFGGVTGSAGITALSQNVVGTNTIISSTSTNFVLPPAAGATAAIIDLENSRNLAVTLIANGVYSNAVCSLGFTRSQDGINWDKTNFFLISFTATTGGNVVSTNVDMGAFRYVCPMMFTNVGSVSNLSAQYELKPGM